MYLLSIACSIPLFGMQPINVTGHGTLYYSCTNINNSKFEYSVSGNCCTNIYTKNISNSSINISGITGNSTLQCNWWYGNPPQVTVHNQSGNTSIYIGYSKLFYYTSCLAALGIGMYIGSRYFN
jgi:hypothetical protein